MNKEIVDCIKAEKDKEIQKRKEKKEIIQKIYDFFSDLPEGKYTVRLLKTVTYKQIKKNPIFSKQWWAEPVYYEDITKEEFKEPWMAELGGHSITIEKIDDKVFIRRNEYYDYMLPSKEKEISNWPDDKIQVFYEHLDWFEQELAKEYCKEGKA